MVFFIPHLDLFNSEPKDVPKLQQSHGRTSDAACQPHVLTRPFGRLKKKKSLLTTKISGKNRFVLKFSSNQKQDIFSHKITQVSRRLLEKPTPFQAIYTPKTNITPENMYSIYLEMEVRIGNPHF